VFQFNNNGNLDIIVPAASPASEFGANVYSVDNTLADGTQMASQNSGGAAGFEWRHILNSAASSLTIRSNALANTAVNWSYSKVWTWAPGAVPTAANLNLVNGLVMETKAKSVGDMRSSQWPTTPATYTWGGNYGRGGMGFSFRGGGFSGGDPGVMLTWQTKDPTTTADDDLIVYSPNSGQTDVLNAMYPLGGSPTVPPEHTYRLTVKRSKLTAGNTND
jgi:hypothetical protein